MNGCWHKKIIKIVNDAYFDLGANFDLGTEILELELIIK